MRYNTFSKRLIDSLEDEQLIKVADFFNDIPLTNVYVNLNPKRDELLKCSSNLDKAINQFQQSKQFNKKSIKLENQNGEDILKILFEFRMSRYHIHDLVQAVDVLKKQANDPKNAKFKKYINKIIEEAENYQTQYFSAFKPIHEPGGIYDIILGVQLLLSNIPTHGTSRTMEFEKGLLVNVAAPIIDLFHDLEIKGRFDASARIKFKRIKENLEEFVETFIESEDERINRALTEVKEIYERGSLEEAEQLQSARMSYHEIVKEYKALLKAGIVSKEKQNHFKAELVKLLKNIEKLQNSQLHRAGLKAKKSEAVIHDCKSETLDMIDFIKGVCDELVFMDKQLVAMLGKEGFNKIEQIQGDTPKHRRDLKRAKEAFRKETDVSFMFDSNFRITNKKLTEDNKGDLILPLSQGKIPAMGNSGGLCHGYTAQFLDVVKSGNWNDMSYSSKINLLNEALVPSDLKGKNITTNYLKMTITSGIKWDIQGDLAYYSKETLVGESNQESKKEKISIFKELCNVLVKANPKNDFPKMYMFSIYGKDSAHALGYAEDQNGECWFHDSNFGLVHFKNKQNFVDYLYKYLKSNYPDLSIDFRVHDYKQILKNIEKINTHLDFNKIYSEEEEAKLQIQDEIDTSLETISHENRVIIENLNKEISEVRLKQSKDLSVKKSSLVFSKSIDFNPPEHDKKTTIENREIQDLKHLMLKLLEHVDNAQLGQVKANRLKYEILQIQETTDLDKKRERIQKLIGTFSYYKVADPDSILKQVLNMLDKELPKFRK